MPSADITPAPSISARPLRTRLMGIVNVTPDSFSDGGDFLASEAAIRQARRLAAEGADIIDIGGESTRPGHEPIAADEEERRIRPVFAALGGAFPAPLSIDTTRASTARLALGLGARIVNDIWGFQRDADLPAVAAAFGAEAVLMHNRAETDASLDIIDDMRAFFERSLTLARRAGMREDRIILDPGIGFGKTFEQNLDCLRRIGEIKAMGFRVLVGASRKSFLRRFLGDEVAPKDRLFGTLGAHLAVVDAGADILRVHDVKAHVEALRLFETLTRNPA